MKRAAAILALLLAGCVQTPSKEEKAVGSAVSRMPAATDATNVTAGQRSAWPRMVPSVDASGQSRAVQAGTAPTVIVAGASDFATAVKVLGQFCGRKIDPAVFDTQFVYREPASGNYWFDGFCA